MISTSKAIVAEGWSLRKFVVNSRTPFRPARSEWAEWIYDRPPAFELGKGAESMFSAEPAGIECGTELGRGCRRERIQQIYANDPVQCWRFG